MANAYYATQTNRTLNTGELPTLSHSLESFRAFQWEVEINLPAGMEGPETLTLAAKTVSQIAFTSEDIVVDRVNDKFFYPNSDGEYNLDITLFANRGIEYGNIIDNNYLLVNHHSRMNLGSYLIHSFHFPTN